MGEILLDAHVLIWWSTSDKKLSRKVKHIMEDETTRVLVSAATAWEIATKVRLSKLVWTSPDCVESYCLSQRFELFPVTFAHGERAGSWPHAHGDPFDRMLAAQSAIEAIPLATNDPKLSAFGIKTVW